MYIDHNLPNLTDSLSDGHFKNLISHISHSVQVHPDMALVNFLGGFASAANGKFEVVENGDRTEPLTFFFTVVADSGERKSAVVKIAKAPHKKWLDKKNEHHERDLRKAKIERKIIKKKINYLTTKAAKG